MKTKITTSHVAETRAFYESLFGLSVVEEWDEPDDSQFRVSDLGSFVASLPVGSSFEGPHPRPWGSTYLYLLDPNDIQVIVCEGG